MTFEELYRAHQMDVRRFALYLTGNKAAADDITAETFVRAWAADAPLRAVSLKAYLLTIARNLHRQARRAAAANTDIDIDMADTQPGPERIAAGRAALRSTMVRMQALPELDRAALLMRAFNALPYEDIARALGISVAAAKVKVHRARNFLSADPSTGVQHDR
jgi:RNA polymerase sigma-70 factor (ECF subfamily)